MGGRASADAAANLVSVQSAAQGDNPMNTLYYGDNLDILRRYIKQAPKTKGRAASQMQMGMEEEVG